MSVVVPLNLFLRKLLNHVLFYSRPTFYIKNRPIYRGATIEKGIIGVNRKLIQYENNASVYTNI